MPTNSFLPKFAVIILHHQHQPGSTHHSPLPHPPPPMHKIIHKELSYAVHGVMLGIYNEIGPSLPESFYSKAVIIGLTNAGIRCEAEKSFDVFFRGIRIGHYFVDTWVEEGKITLELKSAPAITPLHKAQGISYLKVTDADLAIVVNFGSGSLETARLPNYLRERQPHFTWQPQPAAADALYPALTDEICKALHAVHVELGPGFLHYIYRQASTIALRQTSLACHVIKRLPVHYQGHYLDNQKTSLLAVEEKILLAPIAVQAVTPAMKLRLKTIMKQQAYQLGIIANFHHTTLDITFVR